MRQSMQRSVGTLLLALLAVSSTGQETSDVRAEEAGSGGELAVILLGTGIPLPNPERATAATLIVAGEQTVLVDTGRNSVVRLAEAGFDDVSLIVYTHYHSDHIAGLGEILVNRAIAGAQSPLPVIGPPGAKRVVAGFREAYALDDRYRAAHHGEHWREGGSQAAVTEAEPGVVWDRDGLRVTMFAVDHDPVVPAVGYRFDYGGKSIVVSGDTKKTAAMVEAARGADILVHEAVDRETVEGARALLENANPRRWAMAGDMLSHHTSTLEAAAIAGDAGVGKLVLTHLVPSIPPQEGPERSFIRGMAEIYGGPIVVGRDGMKITVE